MKVTLHIPVQQYGFIEIEDEVTDKEDMDLMLNRYNKYAEHQVDWNRNSPKVEEIPQFKGTQESLDALTVTKS